MTSVYDEFTGSFNTFLQSSTVYESRVTKIELGAGRSLSTEHIHLSLRMKPYIHVTYLADDWAFIESVILLVDGERYLLSSGNLNQDVLSGGTIYESIYFPVEKKVVEAIALGKSVTMRVSYHDFLITPSVQARFNAFRVAIDRDEKRVIKAVSEGGNL